MKQLFDSVATIVDFIKQTHFNSHLLFQFYISWVALVLHFSFLSTVISVNMILCSPNFLALSSP